MYKHGIHLTPGLTEVRSYAAFFTSFLAEVLRVRFRGIPALGTPRPRRRRPDGT